jgi:hypothetical protein
VRRSALFSPDRVYRYRLTRRWARGPSIVWIMLNPSTADERRDDPTIRRCIGFSRAWGFGGLTVVNLFALRTPEPRDLREHPDPIGLDNDRHITAAAASAEQVVAAWGAFAFARERAEAIQALVKRSLLCLSRSASGAPSHPLYLSSAAELIPYSPMTPATAPA